MEHICTRPHICLVIEEKVYSALNIHTVKTFGRIQKVIYINKMIAICLLYTSDVEAAMA